MKNNIRLEILEDYNAVSKKAASIFTKSVNSHPSSAFGFATGSTPVGMYKEIIQLAKEGKTNLTKISAFNLDEYYPIKASDNQSYAYFMAHNLFDAVNLPFENRHIPNGEAPDANLECERYEKLISCSGGIKVQILGLGHNGHIGFNEPADCFSGGTNFVSLAQETIEANSRFFDSLELVPKHALTMGIYTIMMAEKILLVVTGGAKAAILKEALVGPITPYVPASALQLHRDVVIVACRDAGKFL